MSEEQHSNGETPAAEYVDLNSITDAEQLREVIQNPEKFTQTPPPEKPADNAENPENPENPQNPDNPEPEDPTPPSRNRAKIRIAHLSESEREVLTQVSLGKSLPEAQHEVVTKLVRSGKSLREAEESVFGTGGRRSSAESAPESDKPTDKPGADAPDDPISLKQKEIDGIKAKLAEAKSSYDVTKIEELREKLDDARWEMRDLKDASRKVTLTKEQEAEQAYADTVATHTKTALDLFPDAGREGSQLFEAIQDGVEDKRETNPEFFNDPMWPITLAAEKAAWLGIPSTKHKAGATSAPGEPVPPKKQARQITPASGAPGGSSTTPTETNPEAELEAAGNDPEKLLEFVRKHGRRDPSLLPIADAFAA
jgi:hypothetical protein